MKSILSQIKHAKITSREVLIHLRKNGELKRKAYLKYLKIQYRTSSHTYEMLRSAKNDFNNPQETPNNKKLTMPVDLVKSEMSTMSTSFNDISFLTEAWQFFQKEMMKNSFQKGISKTDNPFAKVSEINLEKIETKQGPVWNKHETTLLLPYMGAKQPEPQSQITMTPASGFDQLNHPSNYPQNNTPLCIQVLKWAQEGKLNLN